MKKTLLSVATVTALTGIASANISANEYVPEDVQQNHDYTYNYDTNGDNYSYYWYYGDTDGSQYANEYSLDETASAPASTTQSAPAVNEAPAVEEVQAPAVQQSQNTTDVQAPAVTEAPAASNGNAAATAHNVAAGKSYVWGGNSATAVDCSALTQQFMKQYKGIDIPRTVAGQQAAGTQVSNPQAGDLVVFNGGTHVGIYIGNGQMLDALNPSEHVGERSVSYVNGSVDGYYRY